MRAIPSASALFSLNHFEMVALTGVYVLPTQMPPPTPK